MKIILKSILDIIKTHFTTLSKTNKALIFAVPFIFSTITTLMLNITFDKQMIYTYSRITLNSTTGLLLPFVIGIIKHKEKEGKLLIINAITTYIIGALTIAITLSGYLITKSQSAIQIYSFIALLFITFFTLNYIVTLIRAHHVATTIKKEEIVEKLEELTLQR